MSFFFILFLFVFPQKSFSHDSKAPYVYGFHNKTAENSAQISLFLSFRCSFCNQALKQLIKYLKSSPKVKVRIYFFIQEKGDKEKLLYILSAEKDIDIISQLMHIFAQTNNFQADQNFKDCLKRFPRLEENLQKNRKSYEDRIDISQEKFFQMHIEYTPTWMINNAIYFQGPLDNLPQIMSTL